MIPSAEERAAVVAALRVARKDGVRDHAQPRRVDELGELVSAALAVHDDALEAAEEPPPELALRRRAPRKHVVRREDERPARAEQPVVELGRGQPLEMDDVGVAARQPRKPDRMLEQLHRDPQPGAAEERAS